MSIWVELLKAFFSIKVSRARAREIVERCVSACVMSHNSIIWPPIPVILDMGTKKLKVAFKSININLFFIFFMYFM